MSEVKVKLRAQFQTRKLGWLGLGEEFERQETGDCYHTRRPMALSIITILSSLHRSTFPFLFFFCFSFHFFHHVHGFYP
ncbi:hypothetical protein CROQUDRAFT_181065 [Cronartium quercuum f. sp. fusiforme G11]|uniref:Uncharacterized protein n=1 Tax=Cronartium quercuum f. sp. fusiforme G11 TaxID=708437 RepID=A0A9P6TAE0_9BASI|nr:hypothetical protein CROQUDRAFT_181065 [Cronartium quercuum f. sp. fusiforme G11]